MTSLSKREREILKLMADGLTNLEIARVLSVSPNSVKSYVVRVFNKLGVSNRTQAVALASRSQLFPCKPSPVTQTGDFFRNHCDLMLGKISE